MLNPCIRPLVFSSLLGLMASTLSVQAAPLAYWTFEEAGSPGTTYDVTGNGNDATAAGVTSSADIPAVLAHSTNSFSFNGSSGYVADGDLGFSGTDPFTVSLWFKPITTNATLDGLVTKRSPGSLSTVDWQFWWSNTDGAYIWQTRLAGGADTFDSNNSGINPALNTWHHLAIVREGPNYAIYLDATNGVATWSKSTGHADINSGHSFCMGNLNAGGPYGFDGLIDDVAIWDRALTNSEVAELASGALPAVSVPPPPPPQPPTGPISVNVNFGGTAYTDAGAASDTGTVWTTTYAPDPSGRAAGNPDIRSLQGSGGWPTCVALNHNYPGSGIGTYGSPAIPLFNSYIHNSNTPTTMTLSGLHSAESYNLYFYGARDGLDETLAVTVGGVTSNMVTAGNTSTFVEGQNYVRFMGVVPDNHGEVQVSLGGGAATVNVLCGLQVEEVNPIAPVQTVPKRDFVRRLRNGENLVFAFLGTSLTSPGWSWVDIFSEWLDEEFPGQTTRHNHGQGASASSEPVHLPYGLRKLHLAVNANPDVVFIEFGTNDSFEPYAISLAQSRANMEGIVNELLEGHPEREVVLKTMNVEVPPPPSRPQLNEYFDVFRDLSDERQLLMIDHYWNWKKIADEDPVYYATLLEDVIHPSLDGYRVIHKPEFQRSLLGQIAWGAPYDGSVSRTLFLWHFDEADRSGAILPAAVGAADMVLTNGALLVPGRFAEGVMPGPDSSGRVVSTAAGTAMETGDGAPLGADPSVTVECWFRLGTGGVNQVLVSKREDPLGGGSSTGLSVWVGSDDRVKASWGLGSTSVVLSADAAPALGLGDAHHVAAIWDADVETVRICLDGVEEASLIVSNAVLALDDSPLVLGNSTEAPWWPLQGVIDEVHITTRDDLFTTGAVQTAAHYADWAWQTFDLATLSAGSGNREGDADNDAFSNGQEQLFAGDPTNAMVGPVPLALDLSGGTGLTYDRLPDGVFRVHYSTNLQVWLDVTQGFGPDTIFDNGNGTESVRFMGAGYTGMSDSVFYRIRGDWQDTYEPPPVFTVSVAAVSSQYDSTYLAGNTLDGSLVESFDLPRHYWLSLNGATTGYITYDFEAPFELTQVRLANTHNNGANDRGSKGYQIMAGNYLSGGVVTGGTALATGDLADGIGGTPPAGNATFETVWTGSEPAVRYATVEITSRADWAGAGIGLNEVEFTVATP